MTRLLPVGLVLALAAAGCGGGGGGGARTSTDPLAKRRQAFITTADTICITYNRRLKALKRPKTLSQFERYAADGLALSRKQQHELVVLDPTPDLASRWHAYLSKLDASIAAALAVKAGIDAKSGPRTATALRRVRNISIDMSTLAESMGLGGCSQNKLQARPSGQ